VPYQVVGQLLLYWVFPCVWVHRSVLGVWFCLGILLLMGDGFPWPWIRLMSRSDVLVMNLCIWRSIVPAALILRIYSSRLGRFL